MFPVIGLCFFGCVPLIILFCLPFSILVYGVFDVIHSIVDWSKPGHSGYSFSRCGVDVCCEVHEDERSRSVNTLTADLIDQKDAEKITNCARLLISMYSVD